MWSLLLSKYTTKTVVAIEWSDAFLRIALLKKKGRDYTLLNADSEALTSACISHGKIIDFVQFCEILLILLKRNHIKNTYAGFVLNTSDTIIKKNSYNSKLNSTQLHNAILLDVVQYISYDINDACWDYECVERSDTTQSALVVITHKHNVEQYYKIAQMTNLKPEVLDIDNYVLQRFLKYFYQKNLPRNSCYLMIGLNTGSYNIHFVNSDTVYFSNQKSLENISGDEDYINTLLPWLSRNIQMFQVEHKNILFNNILIYGDKAEIESLEDSVTEHTSMNANVINPFENIAHNQDINKIQSPASYVLTLGLATRELVA